MNPILRNIRNLAAISTMTLLTPTCGSDWLELNYPNSLSPGYFPT